MTDTNAAAGGAEFGMIGLGVMGENLVLNIEDHGFSVAVWNREPEKMDSFIEKNSGRKLVPTKTLEEFVGALRRPRRIMMMIKAGAPVDEMIERLRPLLSEGDIMIDGGNSWFPDTRRRAEYCESVKLRFIGSGVSGGETGARFGPSLMPGGDTEAYAEVRPVFEAIAAKTDSGACVAHCGPDGAGHFVKMVHNGIEYGDMQLIAEAYDILREAGGMGADKLADVFAEWNRGPLESFLIEITAAIFRVKDDRTGGPLVDMVLDKAGSKGTGKWTAQVALDLAVPIPTIAAAMDARNLSSMKDERILAGNRIRSSASRKRVDGDTKELVAAVHDALYASKICAYAQGMSLIGTGSKEYSWNIDLSEMARIWKGGCIIRARFLNGIMEAYNEDKALPNLLLAPRFAESVSKSEAAWRKTVQLAQSQGIPVPAMSASLAYFDSYRTPNLPQNLTQAQRDYFGAHTYQRADAPDEGFVHTDWDAK
ncbi:MAG TPA: NADP-dependent phosphogluconate dehydrogenase [Thermoanaerobaculia bacterium]|nr:NADP-dependent phosphogluconate dehydrogenase [Thermoanaerobaculia bacterium]